MLMELTPFNAEQVKLTATKLMQNKEKNNVACASWSKIVTVARIDDLRETRSSNGGWIYEHGTKQVVVGLIPLKLHPKRFGRKKTWLRSKGTILSDKFQVIHVLKMIYQVQRSWNHTMWTLWKQYFTNAYVLLPCLFICFIFLFLCWNFITYFQFWDFDHYLDFVLLYWFLMYLLGAIKTILLFFFILLQPWR